LRHIKKQVVQNKAEIGLASTVVSQCESSIRLEHLIKQRLNELVQVVDLLELAARVLVQLAFTRQDMQFFEQLNGLAGAQLFNDLCGCWLQI
jgi:hypothetical protein